MFGPFVRSVADAANRSGPSTGQVSSNRQVVAMFVLQEPSALADVVFYRAWKPGDRTL